MRTILSLNASGAESTPVPAEQVAQIVGPTQESGTNQRIAIVYYDAARGSEQVWEDYKSQSPMPSEDSWRYIVVLTKMDGFPCVIIPVATLGFAAPYVGSDAQVFRRLLVTKDSRLGFAGLKVEEGARNARAYSGSESTWQVEYETIQGDMVDNISGALGETSSSLMWKLNQSDVRSGIPIPICRDVFGHTVYYKQSYDTYLEAFDHQVLTPINFAAYSSLDWVDPTYGYKNHRGSLNPFGIAYGIPVATPVQYGQLTGKYSVQVISVSGDDVISPGVYVSAFMHFKGSVTRVGAKWGSYYPHRNYKWGILCMPAPWSSEVPSTTE